jgi:hypothetical protein
MYGVNENMDDAFFNKLKEDLKKSGLGSELKAGQIFQNHNWSISSGGAYYDKDEGKSREIDIVAHRGKSTSYNDKTIIYNSFIIHAEVKKTEKPWIVFKTYPKEMLKSCAWNNIISAINLPVEPFKLVKYLQEHSLKKENQWIGSGIHEAFKNPDQPSRWYGAFLSAIKSGVDYYDTHHPDKEEQTTANIIENPTEITFIQPLIILDGKLITAELSQDNDIKLEEVHSAAFEFEYKTKNYNDSKYRIDVVTMEGLDSYISLIEKRQESFHNGIIKESGVNV